MRDLAPVRLPKQAEALVKRTISSHPVLSSSAPCTYDPQILFDFLLNALHSASPRVTKSHRGKSWKDYIPAHLSAHLDYLENRVSQLELLFTNDRSQGVLTSLNDAKTFLSRQISFAMKLAADEILLRNQDAAKDHSKAWKVFQSFKDSQSSIPISLSNLKSHFEAVFQKGSPLVPDFSVTSSAPLSQSDSLLEDPFSVFEVQNAILDVNLDAAPGPDGVSPRVLRRLFDTPSTLLFFVHFLNACFSFARVPSQWARSHIFVLYKGKGARADPNSYRGINLLSVFMKVYEKLLLARLSRWAVDKKCLGREQFAFRSGCSTIDAVFLFQTLTRAHFSLKVGLCAVFVDLKKAFPSLSRSKLLERLSSLGLPPKILRAIASLFVCTTSRLRVDDFLSEVFSVTEGVLEGGILSPILFVLCFAAVWDLADFSDFPAGGKCFYFSKLNLWIIVYADDLVVISPSFEQINRFMTLFSELIAQFKMEVSIVKTVGLKFGLPRFSNIFQGSPIFNSSPLELVDSFSYLGVRLVPSLSFDLHLTAVTARAKAAAVKCASVLDSLSISCLRRFRLYYLSFVQSQLYGIELFPASSIAKVSSIRHFAVCKWFDLPLSISSSFTSFLLPLPRSSITVLQRKLSFFERVCDSSLPSVLDALMFDLEILLPRSKGFFFECFHIIRIADSSFRTSVFDFDFSAETERILASEPSEFSFETIARNVSLDESPSTTFLRLCSTPAALSSFYTFLSTLPRRSQVLFVQFVSSSTRWRLTSNPSASCPLCGRPWILQHFFQCNSILPFLNLDLTWLKFRSLAREEDWSAVFDMFKSVIFVWVDSLTTSKFTPASIRDIFL